MKYILIANNKKITNHSISKLNLQSDDIIILFNFMYPFFMFQQVKNHPNKYYISRKNGGNQYDKKQRLMEYAGMDLIEQNQEYFSKIIFHVCPKYMSVNSAQKCQLSIDSFDYDPTKLDCLEPFSNGIRQRINYPSGKNMSTGIITYEWVKKIKNKNDQIMIVGFTSELAKKFHNDDWEQKFFTEEIKQKRCISVGCHDLEEKKYNIIFDKLKWKSYLESNQGAKSEIILDEMKPKNIIDIGCGANLFAESTAKNYKCIGVDFAGNYDLYGNICVGLPEVRNKEFDLVTCYDVLEHLLPSCIDGAIKEMTRISKRFIFKIDYKPSINKVYDSPMHQTVKPKKWWMGKIKEYSKNPKEKLGYIYGDWN